MKRLIFSVCAYLLFGSIQAHAAVVYAASRCDGCTSAQMTASAKAQGPGNRYVANLKDNVLGYYLVENERIDSGGKTITIATPQVPDPALVSYVGVATHFYAITNGTMIYRKRIAIPHSGSTLAAEGDSAGVADGRMHVQIPTFVSAASNDEPSNSSNSDSELGAVVSID